MVPQDLHPGSGITVSFVTMSGEWYERHQSKDLVKACDGLWWPGDRRQSVGTRAKGGEVCVGRLYLVLGSHHVVKRGQNPSTSN